MGRAGFGFGCGGQSVAEDGTKCDGDSKISSALSCIAPGWAALLRCTVMAGWQGQDECGGGATDVTVHPSQAVPACAKCGSDGRRWRPSCGSIPRIGNGDGVVRPTPSSNLLVCVRVAGPAAPDGGEIQIPFFCVGIGHGCCQTCIITPDAIEMLVMSCSALVGVGVNVWRMEHGRWRVESGVAARVLVPGDHFSPQ